MMSNIREGIGTFNVPAMILVAVLTIACSALAAMAVGGSAEAKQYPYHPLSVRDDRCYSSVNAASNLLGQGWGLVNAIVNAPVYDWDQGDHIDAQSAAYAAYNLTGQPKIAGLRGSLTGKSVGYAQDFRFTVQPVPNLNWMFQYLSKQLPNDAGKLAWLSGGPNPVVTVDGSHGNPYIANPFIYMQSALLTPSGFPQFQVITGSLADAEQAGSNNGALDSIFNPGSLGDILGSGDGLLTGNKDLIDGLGGGTTTDGKPFNKNMILATMNAIRSGASGAEASVENLIGLAGSMPGIKQFSAYPYEVKGAVPEDNCYETLTSANQVPAYAFSMPGVAIPITLPGWAFSILTVIDGKGLSSSGMTIYGGGSINGKAMLDCYGRGVTPTVVPHDTKKIRDYNPLFIWNIWEDGFGSYAVNSTLFTASLAADAATAGSGEIMRSFPAVVSKYETYTSGFAFLFRLTPGSITLPDHLSNRVIDYNLSRSKISDINLKFALGGDGHNDSQNAQQFNPDLYIRLKQPYELKPRLEIGDSKRQELDGTKVRINISNKKTGFTKGSSRTDPYAPSSTSTGGPTYDDNATGTNRAFTHASVYRIVMKPGVIPNAIDYAKMVTGANKDDAYYDGVVPDSGSVCDFLRQKLASGDDAAASRTQAKPSDLTGDTKNDGRAEFAATDAVECDFAAREDGTQVRDVAIRMSSGEGSQSLYDFEEKIPAETAPGTKYCYAVFYDSYSNDLKRSGEDWWNGTQYNYNNSYKARQNSQYLSKARCVVSGYKPSLQVRGGDLMVDGGVYTGTNTKDSFASRQPDGSFAEQRTYGSWAEYGILATGEVKNMGSGGSYRTGLGPVPGKRELGYLTFTNNRSVSTPLESNYGQYHSAIGDGFDRVTRQFSSMSEQAEPDLLLNSVVDLKDLTKSGVYKLKKGAPVSITNSSPDQTLPKNLSIILLADEGTSVNIADNIKIPTGYQSVGDISQVVIAPATAGAQYTINVGNSVSQVDAWLLAPNGTINTCYTGLGSGDRENIPRSLGMCDNTLMVNGPVSVKTLLLRRNGGKDQSTDPAKVEQSVPGETFNLRPDAYLWAASYVDNSSKKFITTNAVDLPPRY